MAIDRSTLEQVRQLLRPLANRIANLLSRGTVSAVNDGAKLQRIQVGALVDEDIDDVEHHQPYGFSSVPHAGAEAVAAFPNGDRAHPIAVVVSDRRHRPTGGQVGEVCLYTDEGDVIRLGRGHVVSVETSGEVRLGSATASQAAIKGTQRNSAEQTFLDALSTYLAAIKSVADPSNAATPTLLTAIGTFKTAIAGALSTKVKLE